MLKNKNKFFDTFKLWLPRVEACRSKPYYLQIYSGREFISTTLQTFYQKPGMKIKYAVPYIHKKKCNSEIILQNICTDEELFTYQQQASQSDLG